MTYLTEYNEELNYMHHKDTNFQELRTCAATIAVYHGVSPQTAITWKGDVLHEILKLRGIV